MSEIRDFAGRIATVSGIIADGIGRLLEPAPSRVLATEVFTSAGWTHLSVVLPKGAATGPLRLVPRGAAPNMSMRSRRSSVSHAGTWTFTAASSSQTQTSAPPPALPPDAPPPPPIPPPPDPPPVTGSALATYDYAGHGWTTAGVVLPEGAATGDLVLSGAYGAQTDGKRTWGDGTIRHAIVSCYIPAAGSYDLMSGTDSVAATLVPVWPAVTLEFTIGGVPWVATLPAFSATNEWLSGPLVREARAIFSPMSGATPHPLLQVVADIRTVYGNQHKLDLCIQNVKDIAAGGPVTYHLVIKKDGVTIYSKSDFTHHYLTRHRRVFTYYTEAYCQPDFAPFIEAQAIPEYLSTVVNTASSSSGPAFDIGGYGNIEVDMSTPGAHLYIGPVPDFTAQYLAHKTRAQFDSMIANANISGTWRGHITLADGTTIINRDIPGYSNYWPMQPAPTLPLGAGPQAARVAFNGAAWAGGFQWIIETAHHPSLNFVPYLVTGDRFHLDQMRFWCGWILLDTAGSFFNAQVRGAGWAFRSMGDIAAYIPDADPLKSYFETAVTNNLTSFNAYGSSHVGGTLEFVFPEHGAAGTNGIDTKATALWANAYVAWGMDRCQAHGYGSAATLRDRIVRTQIAFFGNDSAWPKIGAAPYYPVVGATQGGAYYNTLAECYAKTHEVYAIAFTEANWAYYAMPPFAGNKGPEARLMLQIGIREGIAGAQAAYDYLMPFILGDINARSAWAVKAAVMP